MYVYMYTCNVYMHVMYVCIMKYMYVCMYVCMYVVDHVQLQRDDVSGQVSEQEVVHHYLVGGGEVPLGQVTRHQRGGLRLEVEEVLCMYVCMSVCMYVCIYVCMYEYMYV